MNNEVTIANIAFQETQRDTDTNDATDADTRDGDVARDDSTDVARDDARDDGRDDGTDVDATEDKLSPRAQLLIKKIEEAEAQKLEENKKRLEKRRHQAAARRKKSKAQGKCTKKRIGCEGMAAPGKAQCNSCANSDKKAKQELTIERNKNGLCECGQEEVYPNKTVGKICIIKMAARRHLGSTSEYPKLLALYERQKGHCDLCNDPIIVGDNANIGHKLAASRIGKRRTEIINLYWICETCNSLQGQYHYHEFLCFVQSVYTINMSRNLDDLQNDFVAMHLIKIYHHMFGRPNQMISI